MGIAFRANISMAIANGQTASNSTSECEDAALITIQSPAALDAGTYVIQVSDDNATWANYQEGLPTLADAPFPAASKATIYQYLGAFKYFRISGPTAGAIRTFIVRKIFTI